MSETETTQNTQETPLVRMPRKYALAISLLLPCLLYAVSVMIAGDTVFVFTKSPPGREQRAALAIRDNVIPFYKWGTLLFTRQYLNRYYAESWYFTQNEKGACKDEFIAALSKALDKYPAVDLYLLAHSNKYIEWVESLSEAQRQHIRFVYNTGCHNQSQGETWLALGADAYIGHPGESDSPFFYYHLLRHWTRGETLAESLELGNRRMAAKFNQIAFFGIGHFNPKTTIEDSTATCLGNAQLRIEEVAK
jgi:hypothetical protein